MGIRSGRQAWAVTAVTVTLLVGACAGDDTQRAVAPLITVPTPGEPTSPPSTMASTAAKAAEPTGAVALTRFTSCSSLLRHFKREALKIVTPYGLPGDHMPAFGGATVLRSAPMRATVGSGQASADAGSPAAGNVVAGDTAATASEGGTSGGAPYSGTNIQEQGVDEPDLVKSDGRRLVTIARGLLNVVDITGAVPRKAGTLPLPADSSPTELLLSGDRAVVLAQGWGHPGGDAGGVPDASSTVRVVDLAEPSTPRIVATMVLEGRYVSARLAGGVVRLVVEHHGKGPQPVRPLGPGGRPDTDRLLEENKAAIQRSRVSDWLPSYTLDRPGRAAVTAPLAPCSAVLRPKAFAGLGTVSVLTLDPADPEPANPACVLGGGHIVYAGPDNLYVATERWPDVIAGNGGTDIRVAAGSAATQLHRFAIAGREPAAYVASGEVEGTALNQFSMSELDGRLRIATTVRKPTGATESIVHVLEAQDGRLVSVGRLGNLGHEGETIQSVRFIGTRGYVVTFRQTDPLYVIDLQDPRRPQLRGELQVPGFSSYLHPLSDSVLLGVGQGPGEQGGQGLQLSLFDVRDPARPVRIANQVFENTWSPAQQDHHAFLWWAPASRLVIPVQEGDAGSSGVFVLDVDPGKGFGPVHRVRHPEGEPVQRSMVSGPRLLTLSPTGLMTSDLASLARQAWLPW